MRYGPFLRKGPAADFAGSCHRACPSSDSGLRRTAAWLPGLAPCWPPPSRRVCAPWPCSNGLAAFERFALDLSAPRETLAHQDHETQNLCNSKLHFFSCFKHLTFPNCLLQFFSLSRTSYSLVALLPALAGPLPQLPALPGLVDTQPWWSHVGHSPRRDRTKTGQGHLVF